MSNKIEELENKASEPDFWNDAANSQAVLKQLKVLKEKLGKFTELEAVFEEIQVTIEIGNEEQDLAYVDIVAELMEKFKSEFSALRLETLLTGEYDANNAIITLHSGAGGTEANDWTQMILRMY